LVQRIVDSQRLRGPDYQAVEVVDQGAWDVTFGHDRLGIIDLTPEANQPMWDVSDRYCLVFNGEIYNYLEVKQELVALGHAFRTASDSEVIIEAYKAWGPDCLERFIGMFAFALLDRKTSTIFLARDRFGVKPFCYYHDGGTFVFASTGSAIAEAFDLKPDLAHLRNGLQYLVYDDEGEKSAYIGLRALPAGTWLQLRSVDGSLELCRGRYYDLGARVEAQVAQLANLSDEEAVALVTRSLEDAVRLRLRSDVPVGVSLSGGLDSSVIAAIAAEHHPQIVGFTYGHPDESGSEGPLVAALAAQTRIRTEYIRPDNEMMCEAFWQTLDAQDAPFPTFSMVAQYLVCRQARESGIRVILGGQGGDEAFMGYRKYLMFKFMETLRGGNLAQLVRAVAPLASSAVAQLSLDWTSIHGLKRYVGLSHRPVSRIELPTSEALSLGVDPAKPLRHRQILDFERFSLPSLLRYEDRNSMGNSIESRLPFLDHRVVELAIALPDHLKLRDGYGKWVVRASIEGRIPEEIRVARYKRGFDVETPRWIRAGVGRQIRECLSHHRSTIAGFMPGIAIEDAFDDERLILDASSLRDAIALAWLVRQPALLNITS